MDRLTSWIDLLDGNGFVEVANPNGWKDMEIELSFENPDQKLSIGKFQFTSRDQGLGVVSVATALTDHVANGLTGGVGIFEGLPYQIRLECSGQSYTILDSYLDTAGADYSCDVVDIEAIEKGKIDFLNKRAESFRFEYLYSLSSGAAGRITSADFIPVYYQVGAYPQGLEIVITALTLYVTLKEIYETIKRIADAIAAAVGGVTGAAETALQIIALVAYLILVIVALVNLIQTLIDLIFPWVYYHNAMLNRTLWQRACAYLGLNFSSSFYASTSPTYNKYIMPPQDDEGVRVGVISSESGVFKGTFGEFIRGEIETYNAKIKIIGNTLYFETDETFQSMSTFIIPQTKYDFYGYNAKDVPSNYVISYLNDSADLYSFENPIGTQFQVTAKPITVVNNQAILLENLEERICPYALSNVKTSQSQLEQVMAGLFNGFANLVNAIASLVGPPGTIVIPSIPSSINVIKLDTHFTSVARTGIYLSGGYTDPNTNIIIGAKQLFDNYHFWRCPVPVGLNTQGNQWKRFKGRRIPMCCEDYLLLKDMNYATYRGLNARLKSIKWNPYLQVADIDFEVNEKYTDNLSATTYNAGSNVYGTF